jgi:hypothetical protein
VRKSTCPDLVDTDNNGQDFEAAPPLPRNRAFPPAPTIVTQPADQLACPGWTATFRVKATGVCITSWQWQVHAGNGWADVTTGTGADTPEYTTPLLSLEENGNRYRCVVTNAHGSTASEAATLSIGLTPADRQITITQIYGGGGNLNATYQNDFIELFNRGATPVDLSGWSVQYASDKGSNWTNRIHLAGAIQPGRYFLIQAAAGKSCAGAACGEPLPVTPDATGSVNLGSGTGKIALVKSTEPLTGSCPDDCRIVDLVGYGKTASCFEGLLGPAPSGSSTQAIIRKGGCAPRDVNSNAADFELGPVNPRNSTSPDCGPCHRPYADADGDGDVDQADFGAFQECFSGHGGGIRMGPAYACDCFDRDGPAATGDGDVDEADWEQFSHCAEDSGPNIPWNPANPACLP